MLSKSEIDERLSTSISSVQFVNVPLSQFVGFVADLANLPIVIDDAGLARAGKARATKVTVKLTAVTARDALDAALASLDLTCVVREGKLVVTATKDRPSAARQ